MSIANWENQVVDAPSELALNILIFSFIIIWIFEIWINTFEQECIPAGCVPPAHWLYPWFSAFHQGWGAWSDGGMVVVTSVGEGVVTSVGGWPQLGMVTSVGGSRHLPHHTRHLPLPHPSEQAPTSSPIRIGTYSCDHVTYHMMHLVLPPPPPLDRVSDTHLWKHNLCLLRYTGSKKRHTRNRYSTLKGFYNFFSPLTSNINIP